MTATLAKYSEHALRAWLKDHDGFTVDLQTGEHVKPEGFAVGLKGCESRYSAVSLTAADIASHRNDVRILRALSSLPYSFYQGAWRDGESIYLDASIVVYDREEALRLGAEFAQLAIFDLTSGESVPVPQLFTVVAELEVTL